MRNQINNYKSYADQYKYIVARRSTLLLVELMESSGSGALGMIETRLMMSLRNQEMELSQ